MKNDRQVQGSFGVPYISLTNLEINYASTNVPNVALVAF